MHGVELGALKLEGVDAALVVDVQHRPQIIRIISLILTVDVMFHLLVEYLDITVERDVSSPREAGHSVRLVQLVFVSLSLEQAQSDTHMHSGLLRGSTSIFWQTLRLFNFQLRLPRRAS